MDFQMTVDSTEPLLLTLVCLINYGQFLRKKKLLFILVLMKSELNLTLSYASEHMLPINNQNVKRVRALYGPCPLGSKPCECL